MMIRELLLLANTLCNNKTFERINLFNNKISGQSMYNRSLMKLVLFDCNLSEISKERLGEVIKSRENFGLFL